MIQQSGSATPETVERKFRPVHVWTGWDSNGERQFLPFSKVDGRSSILHVEEKRFYLPQMGEWMRNIDESPFRGFSTNVLALVKGQMAILEVEDVMKLDLDQMSVSSQVSISRLRSILMSYPEGFQSEATISFANDNDEEVSYQTSVNFRVERKENGKIQNAVLTLSEPWADKERVQQDVKAMISEMEL